MQTPHIDRIAQDGARFLNAFAVTLLCAPSRASLLTGLYLHAHGITDIERAPEGPEHFEPHPRSTITRCSPHPSARARSHPAPGCGSSRPVRGTAFLLAAVTAFVGTAVFGAARGGEAASDALSGPPAATSIAVSPAA